ncbi:Rhomboid protease GluP [Jeotgalibaca dankookensis]|uniref:Rhomboid protease GluP n=1 Tax=Jeotgalibaca dankookensis TaxID=708126 RepID=A0A1S6IN79_9LACT|nr:rhomboid family intramembrane serine protease [Jeotgalibaca dankookensis]AQS52997.1 Rhomboid protease GluP [Jeotgalibaca dankookensis]
MKNLNINKSFLKQKPVMTYLFLALQLFVYVLLSLNGGSTNTYTLIAFGAKFSPAIIAGEWWRLVTPIFIHIGFTHILLNSITLYYLGSQMEWILGSWRFAIVYLLGGIMGNTMSFAFSPSVSAGASTSLFGLFAAAIVLGRFYPTNYTIRSTAQGFAILIALNFVSGIISPGIDNWGHLGGVLGGGLAAILLGVPRLRAINLKTRTIASLAYIILFSLFVVIGTF